MRKERIQKEITGWIPYILLIAGIYLLFHVVLFGGLVPSSSMAPTLSNRCITLGMRFGYSLNRYDIVDFERESKETKVTYVKRIIGLPGETIEIRSGTTYIDGEELDEPYLAEKPDDAEGGTDRSALHRVLTQSDAESDAVVGVEQVVLPRHQQHFVACRKQRRCYVPEQLHVSSFLSSD